MSTTIEFNALPYQANAGVLQGDSYKAAYTFQVDDGSTVAAMNFTNATLALTISTAPEGTALVTGVEITDWTASGVKVDNAAAGQITVYVRAADTQTALGPGWYWYEVTATWTVGDISFPLVMKTLLQGAFVVGEDALA